MDCSTLGFPGLKYLSEFAQTHVHWIHDAIQPSHPLLSPYPPPSIFPSIGVFSSELALHVSGQRIGASASASVLPVNIQGWFPFRLTGLISLLSRDAQESSPASVLWCSAIFMVQLSHLYMTTEKTVALSIQTFFGRVMPLLFNTLSRFVIAFLLRSKCLNFMAVVTSAVILECKKIKSISTISLFWLFPHLSAMK